MDRTYFVHRYKLDNQIRYLIEFSPDRTADTEKSGIVLKDGLVATFRSISDLKVFVQNESITLMDQDYDNLGLGNLDAIAYWLKLKKMKRSRHIDCPEFLYAWNLFQDISNTIGANFDPNKGKWNFSEGNLEAAAAVNYDLDQGCTDKIYEKIFWGNNPPSMTPPGRFYVPLWSSQELRLTHKVLSYGLKMFRTHTKLLRP